MGLEQLIAATSEVLPDGRRRAFAAAQKASIDYKKSRAQGVVAGASAAAIAIAATPIPFADAFLLVPTQVAMLAGISATFGLELSQAFLTTLVGAAAGAGGAALVGRTVVANLLKLVPGAGWIAGGAIASATAAALTVALGEAYIATLVALYTKSGGEPPTADAVTAEFKKRISIAQA